MKPWIIPEDILPDSCCVVIGKNYKDARQRLVACMAPRARNLYVYSQNDKCFSIKFADSKEETHGMRSTPVAPYVV